MEAQLVQIREQQKEVWSEPEKNLWATSVLSIINKNMNIAPPPQGAPGLFRCSKSGLIPDLFERA